MNTKQEIIKELEELKARQEKLESLINQLPDPKKSGGRQRPEVGATYYVIGSGVAISSTTWIDNDLDNARFSMDNVYETEEEAQKAVNKQLATVRVTDRIAELNAEHGWVADWNDHLQKKWALFFNYNSNEFCITWESSTKSLDNAVYGSKETIERVMAEMPDDCKLMFEVDSSEHR